jgi:hypothetical protein
MAAVRLESPAGSVAFRRQQQQQAPKMYNNGGWSTLGRSTGRQLQQQHSVTTTTTTSNNTSKTMTLRRHRSRSRGATLHCLSVPELSSDEEEDEGSAFAAAEESAVERVEEENDCYCYADWHQQESYQPALVVWTPGLNHHQWSSGGRSSTPIKTATLRSALRSSITHYGD